MLVAALLSATSAHAHSDSVSIDVVASIKERCGFAAGGPVSYNAPRDLESAADFSFAVGLDCNTPYALGVTSQRGALTNLDASDDGSGFAFSKSYRVSISLETDKGMVRSERCGSGDLIDGGRCSFASPVPGNGLKSGPGISIGRNAVVKIDWPAQSTAQPRLAAGHYKDTLILVVGPRA
ncbi:hypothetical protein EDF56_102325 [Novosphingobium sp. PhB165]|uniref:hypothetical protein n=1 Tax=Novosphingobium sp. PhB165 TaxID=2485105 RepID=UPI0010527B1B|nr:hypothetical protein [Novosphingobium sp. PhB165]TCM20662.1 hypothetical protein EDF56_102325 [Novosphingobium sp. PhB165]